MVNIQNSLEDTVERLLNAKVEKPKNKSYQYFEILNFSSKLIYQKSHLNQCLPFYILIQYIKFSNSNQLQLVPISQKLYDALTKNEYIQSSYFIIVSENHFPKLNSKYLNWTNLKFTNKNPFGINQNNILSIIDSSYSTIKVPILTMKNCSSFHIFVSIEFYNFISNKYNLNETETINVSLELVKSDENVICLAKSATICLLNNPYELSNVLTDEILKSYFRHPQIIYRNHIQKIHLTEQILGPHLFCKYFHLFNKIKFIYFRCNHLDSKFNSIENIAIVLADATDLHQVSSVNASLPMQKIDNQNKLNALCPIGLFDYFQKLKASIYPFFQTFSSSSSGSQNTNSFWNGILPTFLLKGEHGTGKSILVDCISLAFGSQLCTINCIELTSHIGAQTEVKIKMIFQTASTCQPVIICLRNFEALTMDNEGREDARIISIVQTELQRIYSQKQNHPIIIIALTNETKNTNIQRLFLETIELKTPTKNEREDFLHWFYNQYFIANQIKTDKLKRLLNANWKNNLIFSNQNNRHILPLLKTIAKNSQGFLYGDLRLLFDNCIKEMYAGKEKTIKMSNFNTNLLSIQAEFSDSLGVPKVPTILWSDIGGLAVLKDDVQSSIELPLNHNQLMGKHLKRSGILLYGPPGTGKTLIAKAVATECSLNFLSVQGPELLNMYIGQSEQNVREVFSRARAAAPCVVFLDELDSLAPNRGATGDSGGVMDRVVSQLLAEIDKIATEQGPHKLIFILAATNRPDLIDPALLRPGRFEKLFYVGPCKTSTDIESVVKAQTKRFKFEKSLTVQTIAKMLQVELTGADVYSVCANAWINGVRRKLEEYAKSNKSHATKEDILIRKEDFQNAIGKFVPSVMKKELAYYEHVKNLYTPNSI